MRKSSSNSRAVLGNVELLVYILKVLDELLLRVEACVQVQSRQDFSIENSYTAIDESVSSPW
jgi:hypothetical protein